MNNTELAMQRECNQQMKLAIEELQHLNELLGKTEGEAYDKVSARLDVVLTTLEASIRKITERKSVVPLFVHITNPEGDVLEAVEVIEKIEPMELAKQIADLLERSFECRTYN